MDAKIITGFLLSLCFLASISVSQSASLDSSLRLRRQNEEEDAGTTEDAAAAGGTTEASNTNAAETVTAILADGTTIVLPPGTTATVVAEDTSAATESATATGEPAVTGTVVDATTEEAVTGASEEAATAGDATLETSTIIIVDNGTDAFTSVKPGNGHATEGEDASNDTSTVLDVTTSVEGITLDANITTIFDNETSTEVTGVTGVDGSPVTVIGGTDAPGNETQPDGTEVVTPSPGQPGPSGAAELRVVVNPDVLQVQRGRAVELSCTVYGGDDRTSIYWIQEEPERRYALLDAAGENDKQVSAGQVTLRSRITLDDPNKIGKYTCMAQDSAGNSGSAILTMQEGGGGGGYYPPPVYPGVAPGSSAGGAYLRIVAPVMKDGDYAEVQCEGAAPEDEGSIQWYFNNQLVTDQQPLFPRGKTLHIRPISRAFLGSYRCTVPGGRYTDANSVVTFGGAESGPTAPVQPTYTACNAGESTCTNGRCIPSAYVCDGKNDCGDNSDEGCARPDGSGSDICQPSEIRCANSERGRKCVQKFWMCDGDRDCDDGSDEDQRYCELLPRQRNCKPSEFQCGGPNASTPNPVCIPRSFQCDGYNDCPDRSDEVGCVKPNVISPPQRQVQINAGQALTLQCTARGSPAPYINWRLNWGHICGDGSDNGRCTMAQSIDASDPTLVTGTLTVRNTNGNDGGAYSCEALNNQGFIFAIPDAIVNVIIRGQPQPLACNCNGHSSSCSPDGRCQNCQHHTAGYNCEYCAPGYQGDARRGTPNDCQPIRPVASQTGCNPSGTYTERDGRCVCKYNVEGDRCDQCKRSHFYLNPTTPNGCLACFCSGVSSDCTSTDWRRQPNSLPLNNFNAVPKNFATDRYEAGDRISQRNNGRELALDQNSLGRAANEVLYWKAPKEVLGDVVTLYDGNIDVHFSNDGNSGPASSTDEFIWLRGNNIDLVHKFPPNQQFQANNNATYSVPVNERTFTRKDGTYIDRENILMALSDLDTLLIKINPLGGRRNAVLRGVTLNAATRDGYTDAAPTVEACRCPANYTGSSCEKCAEGYGRPHPLVGIYLGQCWSCRSLCHERSDQCDRESGKCSNCQGNSEGDRCERCRSGYVLDAQRNQCVPEGQYDPYQPQRQEPYGPASRGTYYLDQRPYDVRGSAPVTIHLDANRPEQRIPLQVLDAQTQSIVWGRTDGGSLPANVIQEGNDLVVRNPSPEQAGNYICTVTHPDGTVERIAVYLDYPAGQRPQQSQQPGYGGYPVFSPASPLSVNQGSNQLIQPPSGYQAQWSRADGQPFPSGVYQSGNALQINSASPDQSGTYNCVLYGTDGQPITVPYQLNVQTSGPPQPTPAPGGVPKITIKPEIINLKEGQRMIVQYTVAVFSNEPIEVNWYRLVDGTPQPLPSLFSVEQNRLVLNRASPDVAGEYQVVVRNSHGEDRQNLHINVQPRRSRQRGQQAGAPQIQFSQERYEVVYGQNLDITPNVYGGSGATYTWSKDGSTDLPAGVTALDDGTLRIQGQSSNVGGNYNLDVTNANGRSSKPVQVQWTESSNRYDNGGDNQDQQRSYIDVRLQAQDEQSHQVGRDVQLQCAVRGSVERPYEYTFTKDGQPLALNVQVHPDGSLVVRNAQASDAGRYQCSVTFPRAPEAGTQESSYDLRLDGGYGQNNQYGGENGQQQNEYGQQQSQYVEVTADPSEVTVIRGEKANITCVVKGAQNYKVTWGKYAHETSLPSFARQQGNSVIVAPTDDTPSEQMYLQCQVDVPGDAQPKYAYAPVNVRGGDESSKKKKKRRS